MIIDNRPKLVGILVIRWLIIDTILGALTEQPGTAKLNIV
jgi:hypothetical protein